jgi:MFS family permease
VSEQDPHRGWLSRNLLVLSAVSFFQDAASELLYPILPIFLTVTLGAPPVVVGAVEGVAEGASAVTKLVSGRIADRVRRRPLIGIGYGMAAVGKLLIALATVWPVVLVARVVDRLGKGVRGAPRDALLVVGVPPEARGRAFGLHRTADTAGAVFGPLLGLAGYELLHHRIRPLLWIAVVPAVISVALTLFVRERAASQRRDAAAAPSRSDVEALPTAYWRVVGLLTVFALVNFPDALLLLRLKEIGFSVVGVILAYVAYNAIYAALSFPAGAMSDRRSRRRVFGVGLVFFAIGYVGLGLTRNHVVAWLLLAAYGAYTAATDGVGKAWISSLVPTGRQGSAQGVFQGLSAAGILVAGLWAGLAWGADGRLPLLVSGSVGAALAVWLLLAPRRLA